MGWLSIGGARRSVQPGRRDFLRDMGGWVMGRTPHWSERISQAMVEQQTRFVTEAAESDRGFRERMGWAPAGPEPDDADDEESDGSDSDDDDGPKSG